MWHWPIRYWVRQSDWSGEIAAVEGLVPSLHRRLASWVSSATLDRLLGLWHLPSHAGVRWCAGRLQAVLDPFVRASDATVLCCPRARGAYRPAGRPARRVLRHFRVRPGGVHAPPTSLVGGGARRDLPHCGADQTAVVRGDRRADQRHSAAQPHRAAGSTGGAPGFGSRSYGTCRLRPDRSAPRSAQRRASPLREVSPHTLDFTGGTRR
jgi:hypothetical protein